MQVVRVEAVYSHDDGGWYAEVWEAPTGKTLHTTALYPLRRLAVRAAERWAEEEGAKGGRDVGLGIGP
jgi:hypothetical protein